MKHLASILRTSTLIKRGLTCSTAALVLLCGVSRQAQSALEPSASLSSELGSKLFVYNAGQFSDDVCFQGRLGDVVVWLHPSGVTYQFSRWTPATNSANPDAPNDPPLDGRMGGTVSNLSIHSRFLGAAPTCRVSGLEVADAKFNYFLGNDPSGWRTEVPSYGAVYYSGLYPGVDLKYYYKGGAIEYDLMASPANSYRQIRFALEGHVKAELTAAGELNIETRWGQLVQKPPKISQVQAGAAVELRGTYDLHPDGSIGFAINDPLFDSTIDLLIDPVLYYGSFLGGSHDDQGWGVTADNCGNVIMVGVTSSSTGSNDFPTKSAYDATYNGNIDVFVAKFNTKRETSNSLVYCTYLGGSGWDDARKVRQDGSGNAYVAGYTYSSNFPTTSGAYDTAIGGSQDAFLVKLSADGTALQFGTYLGGSGADGALGVDVNSSGEAFVCGWSSSSNFPTANAYDATYSGFMDQIVTKFNSSGSALQYSTYIGASAASYQFAFDLAVDDDGEAYVVGYTTGTDFPLVNKFDSVKAGSYDGTMFKLSSSGSSLLYSTYMGGSSGEYCYRVAVDANDLAYVTGSTGSSDFPVSSNKYDGSLGGSGDGFVTLIDATASGSSSLVYSTYLGGSSTDVGWGVSPLADGSFYVAGITVSTDFPTANAIDASYNGDGDVFVSRLKPSASPQLVFSTYFGSTSTDEGYDIVVKDTNGIYVAIETHSSGLWVSSETYDNSFNGDEDAYILRIADFHCEATCKRGDINRDGTVDQDDMDALIAYLYSGGSLCSTTSSSPANANCDGAINSGDLVAFNAYLNSCTALCATSCDCSCP